MESLFKDEEILNLRQLLMTREAQLATREIQLAEALEEIKKLKAQLNASSAAPIASDDRDSD
jgi:hypothetical protein